MSEHREKDTMQRLAAFTSNLRSKPTDAGASAPSKDTVEGATIPTDLEEVSLAFLYNPLLKLQTIPQWINIVLLSSIEIEIGTTVKMVCRLDGRTRVHTTCYLTTPEV